MSREFDTGAVRDGNAGKGRCDLLPWNAIIEVSKWCQKGAEHYGEHNVDKGIPVSCLLDSQVRHTSKIFRGWDDEDHYCANAWNALWALEMKLTKPEMVDVPWKEKSKKDEFGYWIPVCDRLPPNDDSVMVFVRDKDRPFDIYGEDIGYLDSDGEWNIYSAGCKRDSTSIVVAWMPLPDCYEGDDI